MGSITNDTLLARQALSLDEKIKMSEARITEWYEAWEGEVYVSFSGGKDSTVLLNLVRSLYPEVAGVFVDTGLEYPSIRNFVKTVPNIVWLKPKMSFKEVLVRYGWPVISKEQACAISRYRNTKDPVQKYRRLNGWPNGPKGKIAEKWKYMVSAPFKISDYCCDVMKKNPLKAYAKESGQHRMLGMMVSESDRRKRMYVKNGCNSFGKDPSSWPIAFWDDTDIWGYLKLAQLPYADIYDKGERRTGCMFCCFGLNREEEPNRFQRMKVHSPSQYKYCMDKLGLREVLEFMRLPYE
jgi:3'-phosphoadenosine 5'-phosphosulfate sulfotransferase (PAPS reductase)/FAD synthetase